MNTLSVGYYLLAREDVRCQKIVAALALEATQ